MEMYGKLSKKFHQLGLFKHVYYMLCFICVIPSNIHIFDDVSWAENTHTHTKMIIKESQRHLAPKYAKYR